jgi:RimJ/RimL family protein N-acetyltransferase
MERFSTDRMIAAPLQPEDLEDLLVMHQDPDVMKYMGGVRTEEQTKRWMHDHFDHYNKYGFGCWVFRDRSDGSFVGRGQLRHAQLDDADEVELGYALISRSWGMGLGIEMAKPLVAIALGNLELDTLIALINVPNIASRRVAEKAGFHFERNTMWKSLPTLVFRLNRG